MLHWFEYQLKNQRAADYQNKYVIDPICNISEAYRDTIHKIKDLYVSPRTTKKIETIFASKSDYRYVDALAPNVSEVSKITLENWINDGRFTDLLNRPSHEVVLFHEPEDFDQILSEFCKVMGIKKYLHKGLNSVKLHVLHPGQMFPLHFDRPQNHDFNRGIASIRHDFIHKRFFLFLDDQLPGQVLQIDHAYIRWKAGDVFDYDQKDDMHGGANFGYWPRHMLMVTVMVEAD